MKRDLAYFQEVGREGIFSMSKCSGTDSYAAAVVLDALSGWIK